MRFPLSTILCNIFMAKLEGEVMATGHHKVGLLTKILHFHLYSGETGNLEQFLFYIGNQNQFHYGNGESRNPTIFF